MLHSLGLRQANDIGLEKEVEERVFKGLSEETFGFKS